MILKKANLQARKTPNAKGQKGNHLVYQITIPKEIINETGWKKGEKINIVAKGESAVFEGDSFKMPDQTEEETVKKGMSNPGEHVNLPDRLRKMENQINFLGSLSSLYLVFFIVILAYLFLFGGVLP